VGAELLEEERRGWGIGEVGDGYAMARAFVLSNRGFAV
jgi:hypothetical protein